MTLINKIKYGAVQYANTDIRTIVIEGTIWIRLSDFFAAIGYAQGGYNRMIGGAKERGAKVEKLRYYTARAADFVSLDTIDKLRPRSSQWNYTKKILTN